MIVNFYTQSDQDFTRAFVFSQSVPAWDSTKYYSGGSLVFYAKQVWSAVSSSTGVAPGTDGTKWSLGSAPKLDLTGSRLVCMARSPVGSNAVPMSVSTDDGTIVITDAANGAITVTFPYSQLRDMPPGAYTHSLVQIRPDGKRALLWRGTINHQTGASRE